MPRYEGIYEVGDLGQIRRLIATSKSTAGTIITRTLAHGYYVVRLSALSINGRREVKHVHKLVCEAFHGPRPKGLVCNHKDGVKTNNMPSNLEWVTQGDNVRHAYDTGLMKPAYGERHHHVRLTETAVREIRALSPQVSHHELARRYGVGKSTIGSVLEGRSWKHVT